MDDFFKNYQHPKWQKKRLEILERDGYQCLECDETENPLHIHHGYYEKDKKPWDYHEVTLRTLCETCHKEAQDTLDTIKMLLAPFPIDELRVVVGYLKGLNARAVSDRSEPVELIGVLKPDGFEELAGMCDCFSIHPKILHNLIDAGPIGVQGGRLGNIKDEDG